MRDDGVRRFGRAIRPGEVDRVRVCRHQFGAGFLRGVDQLVERIGRHEARVVADLLSRQLLFREPAEWAEVNEIADFEHFRGELLFHLQRVAAIDEDDRHFLKDERGATEPVKPVAQARRS